MKHLPPGIGAGAGQDGLGNIAVQQQQVRLSEQASLPEGQLLGIGTGKGDGAKRPRSRRRGALRPLRNPLKCLRINPIALSLEIG